MANPDCEKILNLIPLYVDDLLEEAKTNAVIQHIKICGNCKKELLFMKAVIDKTKSLPAVDVPAGFHESVVSSAERIIKEKRREKIRNLKRTTASLVACAAVLVLSFVTLTEAPEPDEKLLAPRVSENPVNIQKEGPKKTNTEKIKSKPAQATEEIPVSLSEEAEDTPDVFCITTTEETEDFILSYLSQYEEDETGYIVENIDEVIEFFGKNGINTEKITEKVYKNCYIIVK